MRYAMIFLSYIMAVLLIIFFPMCVFKAFIFPVVFAMLTKHKNGALSMSACRRDML